MLSGEGCSVADTTRMLAQKQPHIKRVRNSSLVEWRRAENLTGLSIYRSLGIEILVGERRIRGEASSEGDVDCIGERMPE